MWYVAGIGNVHKSHFAIFKYIEPPNILKPLYLYGGIPLTQIICERVYAAERTANEAPQLVMTKRMNVLMADMQEVMFNPEKAQNRMQWMSQFRDNFGTLLADKESEEYQQHDTALADLDNVIMTQYQLVSAVAGVPATKFLGTQPKGFQSTGENEVRNYHEVLEAIQENDMSNFLDKHYALVLKSALGKTVELDINWNPLDVQTAQEQATTNNLNAQTDDIYFQMGAIDGEDVREKITTSKDSGYNSLDLSKTIETPFDNEKEQDQQSGDWGQGSRPSC